MENIHYYKTISKEINTDYSIDDLKENLEKDHAYIGSQYLYLKNKLQNNAHHTDLREISYKEEKMKIFDESYFVIFILYWILFSIYGLLFFYKGQYNIITSILTIIVMGAFPFFINDLSFFLIKGMRYIYKEIKNIIIYIPNVNGEEAVADVADGLGKGINNMNKPKVKTIDGTSINYKDKTQMKKYYQEFINILENDDKFSTLTGVKDEVEDFVDENDLASEYNNKNNADYICITKNAADKDVSGCDAYITAREDYYDNKPSSYENNGFYWVKNNGIWTKQNLSS